MIKTLTLFMIASTAVKLSAITQDTTYFNSSWQVVPKQKRLQAIVIGLYFIHFNLLWK
jgi:hypothetical protein